MSDQEIIELIKQEKTDRAIKKVYSYFPVVKKFVLHNSGSKEEAEDVFQDALIIFIKKVKEDNFVLTSAINTYLFSVCRFIWMEELRRKHKQMNESSAMAFEYYQNQELEDDIKADSMQKLAQQAVQSIGEKCQQILIMFYYKKISMKNIATALNFASEKVAKNQKYRCMEKAKSFLTKN